MTSEQLQLQMQVAIDVLMLAAQLVSAHPKWLEGQGGNVGKQAYTRNYLPQATRAKLRCACQSCQSGSSGPCQEVGHAQAFLTAPLDACFRDPLEGKIRVAPQISLANI